MYNTGKHRRRKRKKRAKVFDQSYSERCFICLNEKNLYKTNICCGPLYYHHECFTDFCKQCDFRCPICSNNIFHKIETLHKYRFCRYKCKDTLTDLLVTLLGSVLMTCAIIYLVMVWKSYASIKDLLICYIIPCLSALQITIIWNRHQKGMRGGKMITIKIINQLCVAYILIHPFIAYFFKESKYQYYLWYENMVLRWGGIALNMMFFICGLVARKPTAYDILYSYTHSCTRSYKPIKEYPLMNK